MNHDLTRTIALTLVLTACGGGHKLATPGGSLTGSNAGSAAGSAAGSGAGDANPAPPVAPPAGHPKDDLIPRAVLYGNPDKSGLQISPDGAWYGWMAPKDGVRNVWIAPAGDLGQARAVTASTSRPIGHFSWPFDGLQGA